MTKFPILFLTPVIPIPPLSQRFKHKADGLEYWLKMRLTQILVSFIIFLTQTEVQANSEAQARECPLDQSFLTVGLSALYMIKDQVS